MRARAVSLVQNGPALVALGSVIALALGLLSATMPDVALGLTLTPVVVTLLVFWVARRVNAHPDAAFLMGYFHAGTALRVFAVGAQLAIGFVFYRGEVDFVGYWNFAMDIFQRVILDLRFDLLFDDNFVKDQFFTRSAVVTGTLVAFMMLLVGPNIVAIFLVGVPVSAAAAFLFYCAFERLAPDEASRRRFAKLLFLVPSVAFWSVFLGKDVWIFFFLGATTLALARVLESPRLGSIALLAASLQMVVLLRAHVGATVLMAVVAALVFRPLRLRGPALYLRPVLQLGIIVALVAGFTAVIGLALQTVGIATLSFEAFAERAYMTHVGFANTAGGSALGQIIEQGTPAAVAAFIPFGVMTLLFRPFLWEAHNVVAVVAGIENLLLLGFVIVRARSLWHAVAMTRRQPLMLFVVVAFLATAGVLSFDWNLGAAQRHRTMVMPFLFMMLALPARRAKAITA